MRKLAKDDPAQYRKVFKEFRDVQGSWSKGGRGQKRGSFSPQAVVYTEAAESIRRRKVSANQVALDKIAYVDYFTQGVPAGKRLTMAEAQLAWARDMHPSNSDVEKDA